MPYQDPFEGLALPAVQQRSRGAVSRAGQQPYGASRPRWQIAGGGAYAAADSKFAPERLYGEMPGPAVGPPQQAPASTAPAYTRPRYPRY